MEGRSAAAIAGKGAQRKASASVVMYAHMGKMGIEADWSKTSILAWDWWMKKSHDRKGQGGRKSRAFWEGEPLTGWNKGSWAQVVGSHVVLGGKPLTGWEKGSRAQIRQETPFRK